MVERQREWETGERRSRSEIILIHGGEENLAQNDRSDNIASMSMSMSMSMSVITIYVFFIPIFVRTLYFQ